MRTIITLLAATAPMASGTPSLPSRWLSRANVSVTLVDETSPPRSPVAVYP